MEQDEPLRHLSHEEFEALRASIRKARQAGTPEKERAAQPEPNPEAEGESSHSKETAEESPQAMELGSKIWEWRKKGVSRYEIHRRLGIPMQAVDELLVQFERHFYPDVGRMMQHYAALDDQRFEDLIQRWLPVATGPAPEVEKVGRNGRIYTELDTDVPAAIVLGAIKGRIQLLAACRPEVGKDGTGATNVLVWLQSVLPGVQKIVQQVDGASVSRERLVLESEAEADINWNGANRSLR